MCNKFRIKTGKKTGQGWDSKTFYIRKRDNPAKMGRLMKVGHGHNHTVPPKAGMVDTYNCNNDQELLIFSQWDSHSCSPA